MDSDRFDGLVRTFSHVRGRRQVLRGLAGVAVGALALGGEAAPGLAKRRHHQAKRRQHKAGTSGKPPGCTGGALKCGRACCPAVAHGAPTCAKGKCGIACDSGFAPSSGVCQATCVPDCTGKCGGVSDGCTGTCDAVCACVPNCEGFCDGRSDGCGGTCDGCNYPCGCQTSADGVKFCSNGGYCRPCTSDAGCAVSGDSTVYYCVDHGIDICSGGYTTTCMTVTCS